MLTLLDHVLSHCRSLTGINGSSEGIVGVLVRGDTASALNISLGSVQVRGAGFLSRPSQPQKHDLLDGLSVGLYSVLNVLRSVARPVLSSCGTVSVLRHNEPKVFAAVAAAVFAGACCAADWQPAVACQCLGSPASQY